MKRPVSIPGPIVIELVMLIGFGLVFLFDLVSIAWFAARLRTRVHESTRDATTAMAAARWEPAILALGILCLVLMMGEKVMVDEIGREALLGWKTGGEWIILYAMLVTQLVYNIIVIIPLWRSGLPRLPFDDRRPLGGYGRTC